MVNYFDKKKKTPKEQLLTNIKPPQSIAPAQSTGSYDKEKGGYTKTDGQFYPTANPNFIPGQLGTSKPNGGYASSEEQKKFEPYDLRVAETKQQAQRQETISQLGLTPEEIAQAQAGAQQGETDYLRAGMSGAIGAVPGTLAAGGAGLLAAGGVAATAALLAKAGVATAATGAGAGIGVGMIAVAGVLYAASKLWNGVQNDLKAQQSDKISVAAKDLSAIKTNMRMVARLVEDNPAKAVEVYDQWLYQAYRSEAKLKLETNTKLERWSNGGDGELADYANFLKPNGQAANLKLLIEQAAMRGSEITQEEIDTILGAAD